MDGPDAGTLIANAHVAAHHAGNHAVSHFQFYSEAMNATLARKLDVETRLHGALERDAFAIRFQPIFDARSREVSSGEVLLRWTDQELGSVPPSEFIPVAEEIGLISAIGDWVIRSACEQARQWRDDGYAPIRLAVNVSPLQIRDPRWGSKVAELVEETEMAPGGLELEITESAIRSDDAATFSTLTGFKEMGVGLALDDFGTGYSSLSYLHRYPIDRVKIDRSSVAAIALEETGTEVTAAILAIAQSLRLRVVAEGIETKTQAEFLADRGCD
jgi:EAL domain-containing protein (putative c-di-GMP-specific phosphodiesterase class I)